jgi:hypothetical protein
MIAFLIGMAAGYVTFWAIANRDALKAKFAELKQKYKPKA